MAELALSPYCRRCGSHLLNITYIEGVTYYDCMNCPNSWRVEDPYTPQKTLTEEA